MPFACKICIRTKALRGTDISSLPKNKEEFIEHLESVHHMRVIRDGESVEEAERRFNRTHPEAADCKKCNP